MEHDDELAAWTRDEMLGRLWAQVDESDPAEPFDFLKVAQDLEADDARGLMMDPAHYQPAYPNFWRAMAAECRKIAATGWDSRAARKSEIDRINRAVAAMRRAG